MEKKKINFINFKIPIDEIVRFRCHSITGKHIADKDIIRSGNNYYYYVFNRNDETSTYSLREIERDEFYARREETLALRPRKFCEEWTDNKNKYVLRHYYDATWRRDIPANDCIFFDGDHQNPLKEIHEAATALIEVHQSRAETYDKQERYEYARKCGGLGKKLGIAYENVMRIGPEKGKLQKFKESYERAIEKVKTLPLAEVRRLYTDLFRRGRKTRQESMSELQIVFFDVDVNLLKLDELQRYMEDKLNAYIVESSEQAKINACDFDYEIRNQMYTKLLTNNRRLKKEVLHLLGVNVDCIDINRYPVSEIKRTLGATLGHEFER